MDPAMPIISSYSRAEAIEDGALIDVSSTAREVGLRFAVAFTRAVWDLARDFQYGLLCILRSAIRAPRAAGAPEVVFQVLFFTTESPISQITLRATVDPGDEGEPVVTVMLPDEPSRQDGGCGAYPVAAGELEGSGCAPLERD
jgi:hypothetical protein